MDNKLIISDLYCLNILLNDNILPKYVQYTFIMSSTLFLEFKKISDESSILKINSLIEERIIEVIDIVIGSNEYITYKSLIRGTINNISYGKCESVAITLAIHNHATILTTTPYNNSIGEYNIKYMILE